MSEGEQGSSGLVMQVSFCAIDALMDALIQELWSFNHRPDEFAIPHLGFSRDLDIGFWVRFKLGLGLRRGKGTAGISVFGVVSIAVIQSCCPTFSLQPGVEIIKAGPRVPQSQ